MSTSREIRATYDSNTITVYQAFSHKIADGTLKAGRFVAPFSFHRMTWIKPSFLWLMYRSQWGQKSCQERIFSIRISRQSWESALSQAVLTSFCKRVHGTYQAWQDQFKKTEVHVQWDPERTIHGKALPYGSIQVGISRHLIRDYAEKWIVDMNDITPLVNKIYDLKQSGQSSKVTRYLPVESRYPVCEKITHRLGMRKTKHDD